MLKLNTAQITSDNFIYLLDDTGDMLAVSDCLVKG